MLPLIDKHDIFSMSGLFRLMIQSESDPAFKIFLQHNETDALVETDEIGRLIIESLPASFEQLTGMLNSEERGSSFISPELIRFYLLLFLKSGILTRTNDSAVVQDGVNDGLENKYGVGETKDTKGALPRKESRISIIIVTFFGERFIRQNLQSIYGQSVLPGDVIVVDNVSGDQTLDIVREEFPEVKIIRNRINYHYAEAVNIGVEAASGDLVVILNQDIVLKGDFIETLYRRYEVESDKESVAAVIPQMRFNKLRTFINGIGNFITEKNWGSDNYFCAVDIGQFDGLKYVSSACFGAIMVTREGWKRIGPLDRTYKSFYEDVDWSMRAHQNRMTLLAAPEAIVFHEFGGSYPSGLKLKLVAKNRMRFVLKHLKGKVLSTFLKKYIKQDIKNGLSFIRDRAFRNLYYYAVAYLRLVTEIPGIMVHRSKNPLKEEEIGTFFTKGAPYVALGNRQLNPVINRHVIRSYYYYTEIVDFEYPEEPILYI